MLTPWKKSYDQPRQNIQRRKWQPTPVFLPGESRGQRILVGYNPWGRKELDTTERLTHTQVHTAVLLAVGTMLDSTSLEFTHPT